MDIKDSYLHGTVGVVKSISVAADKLTYNLADVNNTAKTITLPLVTQTANGLMSKEDKTKLDLSTGMTQAIPYIVGPDTDTTAGTWTGSYSGIKAYTEGLTIIYVPKVAGASTTTLNINGFGAKTCYYTGTSKLTTHYAVGTPILFTYSGGAWKRADYYLNTYASAFCNTAAATSAKTASCYNYTLKANSYIHVLIQYSNTVAGAITLNINSTGAKPIYINGTASSASNYTLPAGTYIAYYDGTNFYFRTDGILPGTIEKATNATSASKVANDLVIKLKSGSTEGTDLYTYNGSAAKTLDIKQGTGITLTTAANALTVTNSGVRSIATGTTNGTISVNTNGTSTDVEVKGLNSAAYTSSNSYVQLGYIGAITDVADLYSKLKSYFGGLRVSITRLKDERGIWGHLLSKFQNPDLGLSNVDGCGLFLRGGSVERWYIIGKNTTEDPLVLTKYKIYDEGNLGIASSLSNGLAPKVIDTNTDTVGSAYYVLASTNGSTTPSWYKLPSTAFVNDDTKVTLTNTTANASYRVLFSGNPNDTTETTTARKSAKLIFNPHTETLKTTLFSGNVYGALYTERGVLPSTAGNVGSGTLGWFTSYLSSGYAGDSTGFPVNSNANGILWLGTHVNSSDPTKIGYGHLLGFSSNGKVYHRSINNGSFPTTANGGSWKEIAYTTSNITGNAATADKLKTSRKLWGLDFDGTADVSGNMTGVGSISMSGNIVQTNGENHFAYTTYSDPASGFNAAVKIAGGIAQNGANVLLCITSGNTGIGTTNPSEKLDVNGNVKATAFIGNIDGTYINALTGYSKASSGSNVVATDTLNVALGKVEYKAHFAYEWITSVTASDTDEYVNRWFEIVDFLNSVKEGTDILDEFVTRKTELDVTGKKTFMNSDGTYFRYGNYGIRLIGSGEYGYLQLGLIAGDGTTGHRGKITGISAKPLTSLDIAASTSTFSGTVTATKFITSGGTSSQFVKGDGSLDSNTYATTTSLGNYLPLTGGTLTGKLTISSESWGSLLVLNRVNNGANWGPSILFNYDGVNEGTLSMENNLLYVGDNGLNKYKVWHTGNDGSGSELDADLLDGKHASAFALSSALDNYVTLDTEQTISGVKTFSSLLKFTVAKGTAPFLVTSNTIVSNLNAEFLNGIRESLFLRLRGGIDLSYVDLEETSAGATNFKKINPGVYSINRPTYTELFVSFATNSGSTSSLELKTSYLRSDKIYVRKTVDSNRVSGAWKALAYDDSIPKTITIGNSVKNVKDNTDIQFNLHDILLGSTIITSATSWNINNPGVYRVLSSSKFTGDGNPEAVNGGLSPYRYGQLIVSRAGDAGLAQFYVAHTDSVNSNRTSIKYRTGFNSTYVDSWDSILDSSNYMEYTVTKGGTGATGTWGINITGSSASCTGNATTATTLKPITVVSDEEFSLSNTSWTNTGYTFANLASGTYAVQVTSETNLVASGIMSVYKNLSDTAGDEIPLHVYSTAGWRPYLRTYANKLLISSNDTTALPRKVTIKIALIL